MKNVKNILLQIGKFLLDILLRIVFVFRDLGIAVWHGLINIKNAAVKFWKRFQDGSIGTKLSHIFMGAGNFAHKQYVKGAIFLCIEIIFIVFMIASPTSSGTPLGAKAIEGFFTLGEYHGMPIDDDYVFSEEFEVVSQLPVASNFETEYVKEVQNTFRITNVLSALENGEICLSPNDRKKYKSEEYTHVIKDNRFDTNDCYAYAEYDLTSSVEINVSDGTLLWLESESKIENLKEAISLTNVNTEFGVYYQETGEGYRYLIITKALGKGDVLTLDLNSSAVECFKIDYNVKYVNLEVDFSFLQLLFGVITFAIIAMFLVVYNLSIASSYKADKDVLEGNKPSTFIEDLKSLLDSRFHITLLTPAIILLVVFTIVPTLLMIMISFTDMASNAASSGQILINWTGFTNFVDLFSGSSSGSQIATEVGKNFTSVLTWTFEWAILATFSCYFGGIFLALLINKKDVKFKKLWRTIFILTIAIPQFITLLVMRNLLSGNGPINTMLKDIGLISESINFLQFGSASVTATVNSDVWLARATVLVINLYIGIPYTMLMTSGILMNIPKDLYEAATIDGANKWQMFRKITLPYVIFVTTPYLISSFIGNITSFNTIFLTTGGGPGKGAGSIAGHTDLLVTWLYKLTMEDSKYNAGSIIGILTFLITAFITLVCYRNSKAYKEEDTFQ